MVFACRTFVAVEVHHVGERQPHRRKLCNSAVEVMHM